jgi:hypothetical protein
MNILGGIKMRNVSYIFTILIFFILVYFNAFSEKNCTYAQQVQKPGAGEPNKDETTKSIQEVLEKILRERQEATAAAAMRDPNYAQELRKRMITDFNQAEVAKAEQKRIEADNLFYKDRVFGNPFRGFALSIAPVKDEYVIGDKIEISMLVKNVSPEKLTLLGSHGLEIFDNFQYALYFPDGNSVPKSEYVKKQDDDFEKLQRKNLPLSGSTQGYPMQPKEILQFIYPINTFFNIQKEGTYLLIIMRRVKESWKDGFMISNMTKINIVEKKDN